MYDSCLVCNQICNNKKIFENSLNVLNLMEYTNDKVLFLNYCFRKLSAIFYF